jgi:hypothetical protein
MLINVMVSCLTRVNSANVLDEGHDQRKRALYELEGKGSDKQGET